MAILPTYGTHAKAAVPKLNKIADYFEKDQKDFPEKLMIMKANWIRETVHAIEDSTDQPELISIQ